MQNAKRKPKRKHLMHALTGLALTIPPGSLLERFRRGRWPACSVWSLVTTCKREGVDVSSRTRCVWSMVTCTQESGCRDRWQHVQTRGRVCAACSAWSVLTCTLDAEGGCEAGQQGHTPPMAEQCRRRPKYANRSSSRYRATVVINNCLAGALASSRI